MVDKRAKKGLYLNCPELGERFMWKKLKEIVNNIIELSLIGGALGLACLVLRPFVSLLKALRDVISSVIVAIIVGLLLDYTDLVSGAKYGIVGVCSCFAPHIFKGLDKIAESFSENPEKTIKKAMKIKDNE